MNELYENIRKYRILNGMTQDELAKKTGYTDRSSIAKIERGDVDLPQSKIMLFAKALGVDAGTLMGDMGIVSQGTGYYENDDTAALAQELYDNPELKALLDSARDVDPTGVQLAIDMLKRFKQTNPDG